MFPSRGLTGKVCPRPPSHAGRPVSRYWAPKSAEGFARRCCCHNFTVPVRGAVPDHAYRIVLYSPVSRRSQAARAFQVPGRTPRKGKMDRMIA